jgi:hypothetical protein
MKREQVNELLYQALETEVGGQQVYETALRCAENDGLKEEWKKYLDETRNHQRILQSAFQKLGLDPMTETPGRAVVRHLGDSLVEAMQMALEAGQPAAQLVAAECVVLAETKDHANWELIGKVAPELSRDEQEVLTEAFAEVEEQEDEHLFHTKGWSRELWLESLGMPAVLPPPEEKKSVKTAIGAARAEQSREEMLKSAS